MKLPNQLKRQECIAYVNEKIPDSKRSGRHISKISVKPVTDHKGGSIPFKKIVAVKVEASEPNQGGGVSIQPNVVPEDVGIVEVVRIRNGIAENSGCDNKKE